MSARFRGTAQVPRLVLQPDVSGFGRSATDRGQDVGEGDCSIIGPRRGRLVLLSEPHRLRKIGRVGEG